MIVKAKPCCMGVYDLMDIKMVAYAKFTRKRDYYKELLDFLVLLRSFFSYDLKIYVS